MLPSFRLSFVRVLVFAAFLLVSGNIFSAIGQCTAQPVGFTLAGGPYRAFTYTLTGITVSARIEIFDTVQGWQDFGVIFQNGTYQTGANYGHNSTRLFRAFNFDGVCFSAPVQAIATTPDVGYPWLYMYTGFVSAVEIETAWVPPDMNTGVLWSRDGVNYTMLHVWTNPPNPERVLVPLAANETTYFYSFIDLGTSQRYSEIKAARVSPDQDWGPNSCGNPSSQGSVQIVPVAPSSVGKPVNVTNGNMYLTETDYSLPGKGESISVSRNYNSLNQSSGLFGHGWSFEYDQSISLVDARTIRLGMNDGRGIYFANLTSGTQFKGITPGFPGTFDANTDGTFTLTFNDGTSRKFSTNGKLLWLKDRNGNQTTVNYNGSGILTGVTDAFGRTLTITVGTNGLISQISDALGVVADYDYFDSTSLLKTVTYPDGSMYKFEYDQTSVPNKTFLKTVKDALDNILETHEYDPQGRATTSEVHGDNEKYELDYSNWSASSPYTLVKHRKSPTDPFIETKFHFAPSGIRSVVNKVEGLCGCGGSGSETTQYFYDSELNLVKIIDAELNETTYAYDSSRNLTSMTDVLGTQTFTYNGFGQVLTATDRMSGVTTNTYNTTGDLLTTTDASGKVTTFTYSASGLPLTIEDARNNTTTLTWDSQGRMTKVEDANNKETDFAYDARARLTSFTNALSETTEFEYDDNNRVNKVIYPDTNEVNIEYDLAGRKTSVTDELGHETTYGYDEAYRLTSITDALNHTTTFGYDLMSNLTSSTDALGNVTRYEYNDFNRLKKVVHPAPSPSATPLEETTTYDKNGNVITKVDTAGRTTTYDYDDADRLVKITDALSNETEFTYNARSQMTKVTDALNQEYTFTYDAQGRVLTQVRNGQTTTFTYDLEGNKATRTDYNGNVTSYTYDELNRLTNISYTGASYEDASYTYDDLSRLLTATNAAGTVSFSYDIRGRLASESDVFGHNLVFSYDAKGRRTALEIDSTPHTGYEYDDANRLTTLTDESSNDFTFVYDNANRMTSRVAPNGVTSSYEYDGMSRLKRLKHYTSGATLYDDQFAYNTANQISQIAGLSQTRNFTYDNIDRLTAVAVGGSTVESYSYDAVGNRTASHLSGSYTTGAFNRLTATSTGTYSYDNNGSLTSMTDGATGRTFGWDRENRLVSASSGDTVYYRYDALGRRVSTIVEPFLAEPNAPVPEEYTYDGQDVVMDSFGSDITTYQNGPGIDDKFKVTTSRSSNYFLQDHLGSTVVIANSSGTSVSATGYDSFGNATNGGVTSRYLFTGREYDGYTGLQYSRARWYSPQLGRFISEDPIGFAGGDVNLYGYVGNNPVSKIDSSGLSEETKIWRLQHYKDPATRPYVTNYNSCFSQCLVMYGAAQIPATGAVLSGLDTIPKRWASPGAAPSTSPISSYLSRMFPHRLPRAYWAPTLQNPLSTTSKVGRLAGRWIPIVGAGVMVADFGAILHCTNLCYGEACESK